MFTCLHPDLMHTKRQRGMWTTSCLRVEKPRMADGSVLVAEVLLEFAEPVISEDGRAFLARACGSEMAGGLWQGWIEFVPVEGGEPLRSARATTQPNRQDTLYWATGLTPVYLDGALQRTLRPT